MNDAFELGTQNRPSVRSRTAPIVFTPISRMGMGVADVAKRPHHDDGLSLRSEWEDERDEGDPIVTNNKRYSSSTKLS